jgi:hypothetical protein
MPRTTTTDPFVPDHADIVDRRMHRRRSPTLTILFVLAVACGAESTSTATSPGSDSTSSPVVRVTPVHECPAGAAVANAMTVLGCGDVKPERFTAEIAVRGTTAYTTTFQNLTSSSPIYIWDVAGDTPILVDSVFVSGAITLGDIAVTPDGQHLVVATEFNGGSIVIFALDDARKPRLISQFATAATFTGVHTAEVGTVDGRTYAFLAIARSGVSRIVIVDITDADEPREVFSRSVGTPVIHDTFLRDGILFLALWNGGVAIWDVGGGGMGGRPVYPVELGVVATANGHAHNVWWLKDPVTGSARYAFVGEESGGVLGQSSSGDIHVVDLSDVAAPREVAIYTVPGAGAHNFSVDEQNGILYAAYYNGGVRAIDVRGDLGACTAGQRTSLNAGSVTLCDLSKMGRELAVGLTDRRDPVFVWGVQYVSGSIYASDMLNGIWKLRAVPRPGPVP